MTEKQKKTLTHWQFSIFFLLFFTYVGICEFVFAFFFVRVWPFQTAGKTTSLLLLVWVERHTALSYFFELIFFNPSANLFARLPSPCCVGVNGTTHTFWKDGGSLCNSQETALEVQKNENTLTSVSTSVAFSLFFIDQWRTPLIPIAYTRETFFATCTKRVPF